VSAASAATTHVREVIMTVFSRRHAAVAGVFAAGIIAAATACGSSGSSGSPPASPSPGMSSSASASGVHTAKSASLGTVVVNGKGFTLYRFDADSAKPSASHCTGSCAVLWHAQSATPAASVTGVDHKLVGTVTRGDGSKQLTIAGWPVYTYSQDTKAGATSGQGVDGTWWAVTPSGAKTASHSGSMSPSSTPSGGGYGY
jgi:predicted lipoprotein with Yx(FWY)xxD motif